MACLSDHMVAKGSTIKFAELDILVHWVECN